MINDPRYTNEFKQELTNYFTGFLRKQYNMGVLNRRKTEKNPNDKAQNIKKMAEQRGESIRYRPGIIADSMKK